MTDNDIKKALECCNKPIGQAECKKCSYFETENSCAEKLINDTVDLINRKTAVNELQAKQIVELKIKVEQQKAEIENLTAFADEFKDKAELLEIEKNAMQHKIDSQQAEIDKYQHIEKTVKDFWSGLKELSAFKDLQEPTLTELLEYIEQTNAEAIKEFSGKIHDILMRYAHLHNLAETARDDFVEALDGTKLEMQSVWDAFILKKNEMAEYEEMSRLQENIETIAKERVFAELEKDFRLLVKEMEGEKDVNITRI
jgi:hypothetical protein